MGGAGLMRRRGISAEILGVNSLKCEDAARWGGSEIGMIFFGGRGGFVAWLERAGVWRWRWR